ncbi:MAG: bifunctional UDP-N-acetylmuramoyl-tripeptide:D-alanyl-D-alanine ligase/alanine racemase [Bacteroidota bacterium]|nr:bifunctional UDP-N-acetylmuramoyl-tripeptide:D-alanyl-D-alanine ligase/alanine racemase [Bacteroidota bacterium]
MYTTLEIAKLIDAQSFIKKDGKIQYLLIDSRNLVSTVNALFFAIRGERHDGHDFIKELYHKGVKNFVVEKIPEYKNDLENASFLLVDNTLKALQKVAAAHRTKFNYPVVGITGSNGKTIVKEWLFHLIQGKKNVVRNPKSYNSQVGVPLSVWLMSEINNFAIFEAGISMPGEMQLLEKIIHPDIGLITNVGEAHQENFKDYKEKCVEKLKLFDHSKQIIYCKDHSLIHQEIEARFPDKNVFTWSENSDANLKILNKSRKDHSTFIDFQFNNKENHIIIPFTDSASIEDAIHVLAVLLATGIIPEDFQQKFETLPSVAMRLELKKGINNCTLINDSYNSDLNSLSIALNYLEQQNQHSQKTLIISDILQSGKEEKELYQEVSKLLKKYYVNRLIGIGEALSNQGDLFTLEKRFFKTTSDFLHHLTKNDFADEAILLKGARDFHFEKISSVLEEKSHRTVLEINLNAMVHNLNYFRSKLDHGTKIMAMVKALSYGSGTFEIANILQYQRVDYLGVAFTDEGVALREAGIKMPIIVMNPEQNSFDLMIEYQLEPEIYNFLVLNKFYEALKNAGKYNYPVHLKLDTGMHRLGFMKHEINQLIDEIKEKKFIKIRSVFSHLAASDEDVHDYFTRKQIDLFDNISNKIIQALDYPILRHISNSAGIERFPEAQFDMVRLGIGLYGISATNQEKLATVSTLKSTVIQTKQVVKDETIGYSRKARAQNDMTIAIVPVGYADGLNRRLGNGRGKLFINGFFVPIVGNICMDMCMVDITGCNIYEGDEVIVFGKEQSVVDLANMLETIPYEIFTSVSTRVKRVYFQE